MRVPQTQQQLNEMVGVLFLSTNISLASCIVLVIIIKKKKTKKRETSFSANKILQDWFKRVDKKKLLNAINT